MSANFEVVEPMISFAVVMTHLHYVFVLSDC